MKGLFILILSVCFMSLLNAQIVSDRAEKYATNESIDSFMIYAYVCSGYISIDSCQYEEPNYILWKQKGNYYLKRFDYCKTYKPIQLDSKNPFTFYLENKKYIDKEQIKPPTYYEIKKTKLTVDTLMVTSTISHSCYHKFSLPELKQLKYKYGDEYDLAFKVFDNGKRNIYYTYNQKTKFKSLIDLITALIEELNLKSRFDPE